MAHHNRSGCVVARTIEFDVKDGESQIEGGVEAELAVGVVHSEICTCD